MKQKQSKSIEDDERLTPEEERHVVVGVAQGDAGLTYGPFEKRGISLRAFMKACERTRRVSIRIPAILHEYLHAEAKRFGMSPGELMAVILKVHRFKDRDRQLILLAIEATEKRTHASRRQRRVIDTRLKRALEEVKQKHTAGPFNTADDMIASLKRELKRSGAKKPKPRTRRRSDSK